MTWNSEGWQLRTAVFLSSQTLSLFGSSLVQFALIWYIARTTNSGMMVTLSTICAFLPQLLVSLFAGVWADRYDRKLLIILSDGLIASATLVLAVIFLAGHGSLALILAVSSVRSLGTGIQTPAVAALVPQIVPEDKLMRINAITGTIQSLVLLVSPAIGGAILSFSDLESVLFIDVLTAALAILLLFALRVPARETPAAAAGGSHISELKEGIAYALGHVFVRNLLVFNAIFLFLVVPAAFLNVLMVTRVFGDEYWKLTANEMSFFAGSMVGGAVIAAWGGFRNRIVTLAVGACAFGALTVAIGLIRLFALYLAIMALAGVTMPLFSTPTMTLFQEKVPGDKQGRVFGLFQLVNTGIMLVGMAFFGPLADVVRIETLMIVTGALLLLQGLSIFRNEAFLREGMRPESPGTASGPGVD